MSQAKPVTYNDQIIGVDR